MKKTLLAILSSFNLINNQAASAEALPASLYDLTATSIKGEQLALSQFAEQVSLVVNTASRCGFTSQYEGLEKLYQQYKDKGFVVLGFPSNDYLSQEPGTNEEIVEFCKLNYGVSFPLFAKAPVSGKDKQAVYRFLTEASAKEFHGDPGWNFVKFLVNRQGQVVGRFSSTTKPESDEVKSAIEAALQQAR